ncbi:peptidase C14, caspase domain-containing protein, partial [Armillaria borealis]
VYAVLIGIDGYSTYPLRGCVADALAMKKYFVEYLHVPNERIQSLLGPAHYGDTSTEVPSLSPSRANILSVLLSLITNPDIKYGDPIIIFFAGHGSRYLLSSQDGPDDDKALSPPKFVEAFCPMDRDSRDSNGVPVPDISDRELNTILSQIVSEKGSRITCILDCCHAGSITR